MPIDRDLAQRIQSKRKTVLAGKNCIREELHKMTPVDLVLLQSYSESVQLLTQAARKFVKRWLPDAAESVDEKARLIAYSHGPGYTGMICTLILSKTGVKLGLAAGASLADPDGLLRGSGKVHRYVQLTDPKDLQQPGVKQLLLEASAACRRRLLAAGQRNRPR
jgi:hypothetical protein